MKYIEVTGDDLRTLLNDFSHDPDGIIKARFWDDEGELKVKINETSWTRGLGETVTVPDSPPSFPHAIANPCEVHVYLQPGSPEAAKYQDGGVGMGCTSIEHAEVMFEEETLTRAFPWWVRAVMVERADGGRPARVIGQKTRDLTVNTWRRHTPSF